MLDQNSSQNPFDPRKLQQIAALERARQTPRKKPTIRHDLKTDYLDDDHWVELAAAHDWRLPQKNTPCTTGGIAPWIKRLGLNNAAFVKWCGYTPTEWIAHNPPWTLRALVGLLLEDFAAV